MFEEWVYTNKTLKLISPTITDDIIEKIKKQRNILQGYHYARQLSFCYLDMNVHSKKYNHNSFETNKKITKEILGLDVQENTNSVASFGHLMGGYDAGYYGYLWSLVYAKDLFTKFSIWHLCMLNKMLDNFQLQDFIKIINSMNFIFLNKADHLGYHMKFTKK